MRDPTPIVPGRGERPAPLALAPPSTSAEIRALTDEELRDLRRALTCALRELELGSRPSRLVWRLCRQARAELARRHRGGPTRPAA